VPTRLADASEELLPREAVAFRALSASSVPIACEGEPASVEDRDEASEDRVVVVRPLNGAPQLLRALSSKNIAIGPTRRSMDACQERLSFVDEDTCANAK
jgi:hypothetical protein